MALTTLAMASAVLGAAEAHASPQARLVYGRSGEASSCPDETALRRAVAARIGYDPFFLTAPRTVVVMITSRGNRLVARVQLVDDDGHAQGARELESAQSDCGSLFDTVALTISIAIDPQALTRPPSSRPEPPPPQPEAAAAPPVATPLPAPMPLAPPEATEAASPSVDGRSVSAPVRPEVRLGAAIRGSYGLNPGPAAGTSVSVGLVWRRASIGLEAQADFPSSHDAGGQGGGTVTGWLVSGALVPCLRFVVLLHVNVCALAVLGRFDATASGVGSHHEQAPYVGLGGRLGGEIPVSSRISLIAQADALANPFETTLLVGTAQAWKAPAVGGALGLGAVVSF